MKVIKEIRKEEDIFYQGPFWIIADSVKDIQIGNFSLLSYKYPCYFSGEYINNQTSKSQKTHHKIWNEIRHSYGDMDFTYYPRGRVAIFNGNAFIHINSICNTPAVIDAIKTEYNISKLDCIEDLNDIYQGSHYNFQLT